MGVSKYDEDFRKAAVQMILEKGKSQAQVSTELGISTQTLRDWVKKYHDSQRSDYARLQELERENKLLKKELHDAKEAVDILKKTAAILSKP